MKLNIPNTCIPLSAAVSAALLITSAASAQTIYVGSFNNNAIYDFTPGGQVNTFFSNIAKPQGLAFDTSGNLYVASSTGNYIEKITQGQVGTQFATLTDPSQLAFNSAGDLFVSGFGNGYIDEISPSGGTPTTFVNGLSQPGGLAFDKAGDLFVSVDGNEEIYEYKNIGGTLTTTPTIYAQGLYPVDLAFDTAGNLYAANSIGAGVVTEIMPGQNPSTYATGVPSPAGVAFDTSGDLFVANNGGEVTEILPGGGTGTVVASDLNVATGLAIQGISLPVPEPSTWALMGLGSLGLLLRRKKA